MLQAAMFDGDALNAGTFGEDGFIPSEVGVRRCHIAQAFVVAVMIIVLDEGLDLGFEVTGQEVVFKQDAVFQGLVPAFDLALGLGMIGRTAHTSRLCQSNEAAATGASCPASPEPSRRAHF